MNKQGFSTLKTAVCAMFVVISLTLFIVESFIPPISPIPGMKIGLAYIPIVFVMYLKGSWKNYECGLILLSRILLSSIFAGLSSFLFSFTGGILSFLTTVLFKKAIKDNWGVIFCSVFSAIMHNVGQLLAASVLYSLCVWVYFPYLLVSGIVTGVFTGLVVYFTFLRQNLMIKKLENI